MAFNVGKGTKIRFWTDLWCGCTVLSQRFPHLYAIAAHRNATMDEMWDQNFGHGGWNLRILRDFNDWELDMVRNLFHVLRGHRITTEEKTGSSESRKRTACWSAPLSPFFRIVAFGWIKFQPKLRSLRGRLLGGRCLP